MTILDQVRNAGRGWLELISGRKSLEPRFNATMSGLAVVIVAYLLVVFLRVVLQAPGVGLPGPTALFLALVVNALPLIPVWVVAWVTLRFLRPGVPLLSLLVPAYWAMAFLFLIAIPLSFLGPIWNSVILGLLGYMLFCAGRDVAGLGLTVAISYAILSILALVTLPLSLYMVLAPGEPGPI